MTLNGGYGAVTTKNVNLIPGANSTEKVTATKHANGKDIWIITHGWQNNTYYSFLLTQDGLNTSPVVSNVGLIHFSNY
ncbi:MAG: hypothetical protein M0R21_10350 [Lentimicrobiaceae bacterium]|nr:hypothetical protein [Lentimicrobiaceae bacterium]